MPETRKDKAPEQVREILPPVDIAETEDGVRLTVEMPGARGDTIAVTVEDDILSVSAERAEFLGGHRLLHQESDRGVYRRSFRLSRDLSRDGLKADYRMGVLTLSVPKSEHSRPRRIAIKTE